MLEKERPNSNRSKTLKSCQAALKVLHVKAVKQIVNLSLLKQAAADSPANVYFWNQELDKVAEIVSMDAFAEVR